MTCRICHEDTDLISVCGCEGTHKYVHLHCVQQWIDISHKDKCELCQQPFQHLDLALSANHNQTLLFVTSFIGIIHGVITWISLLEHHTTGLYFLETLVCQVVLHIVIFNWKYPIEQKWRPVCAFLLAFFVYSVIVIILTPVRFYLYNYNMLIPNLLNIFISYSAICYYFFTELRLKINELCQFGCRQNTISIEIDMT